MANGVKKWYKDLESEVSQHFDKALQQTSSMPTPTKALGQRPAPTGNLAGACALISPCMDTLCI